MEAACATPTTARSNKNLATTREVVGVRKNYLEIHGSCLRNTNNGDQNFAAF
jgi:hypothetical protein